jgi:hypothetical protein
VADSLATHTAGFTPKPLLLAQLLKRIVTLWAEYGIAVADAAAMIATAQGSGGNAVRERRPHREVCLLPLR